MGADALPPGGACDFWLSTEGVTSVAFEAPNGLACFTYHDHVDVALYAGPQAGVEGPWAAAIRAAPSIGGSRLANGLPTSGRWTGTGQTSGGRLGGWL